MNKKDTTKSVELNKEASTLFLQLEGVKRKTIAEIEQQQNAILIGAGINGAAKWSAKDGIITVVVTSSKQAPAK